MFHGVDAIIVGRESVQRSYVWLVRAHQPSAKGLQESADKLSKTMGKRCLAAPADVRDPEQMQKAVQMAQKEFGKIDFVICGVYRTSSCHLPS